MKRVLAVVAASAFALIGSLSLASADEALRVTVNKYTVIKLDTEVGSVWIANPSITEVGIESSRQLLLVGRIPGETMILMFDDEGNEIFNKSVVVVPNMEREVTVYRANRQTTLSCDPRCSTVPNPGRGAIAPGGGAGGVVDEDEERAPPGPTDQSAAIAEMAAKAAASAIAEQQKKSEEEAKK